MGYSTPLDHDARHVLAPAPVAPALSLDLQRAGPQGVPVLGAIRLDIAPSETVALTGPSGIGKTTLLRVIAGLEPSFDGKCRTPERISMVFQEPVLMPWRKVEQNLTIPCQISSRQARQWLADVGLEGLGDRWPGQLSLGQQRRLSLARAFAANPALLLLDEPFVSLDPATADAMMQLFERLRAARPVATLLVTHVRAEADRLADRVLHLTGSPARLSDG